MSVSRLAGEGGGGRQIGTTIGFSALGGVLAELAYGSGLVITRSVSLGYFPVILGIEALAAGLLGALAGLVGFLFLRTGSARGVKWVLSSAVFLLIWAAYYLPTHYGLPSTSFLIYLAVGLLAFLLALAMSRARFAAWVLGLVVAFSVVLAVAFPWLLAYAVAA